MIPSQPDREDFHHQSWHKNVPQVFNLLYRRLSSLVGLIATLPLRAFAFDSV